MAKIPIKKIVENDCDINFEKEEEIRYLIKQSDSLLFDQLEILRGKFSVHIPELILVLAKKNPKQEEQLKSLLLNGFTYNGVKYVRFGKSASQGKDGITAFVDEKIFNELYVITQMDIEIDECVISKYEAQRCLPFSSCTLIKDYIPNIVIIDEYEKVIKNQYIRYVVNKKREITDKVSGEKKFVNVREIEEGHHDIKLSPFDGCGCHERGFSEKVQSGLGLDYLPVGSQVRLPFMKGYSVYVPFKEMFKEMNIHKIKDVYGNWHDVRDIDCIWNTSMFKGHKIFKEKYGNDAWNKYIETLNKYQFKLGISKYSHHMKDINVKARLNFQYLQCLDLWNDSYIKSFHEKGEKYDILSPENKGKIISIAEYTTDLFEKIICGDKFYTYKFMGINDTDGYEPESNYLKAALLNDVMLKDPAIKQFIYRKLKKYIREAKLGKIYADGFYHTVVGDMVGYIQYAAGMEPMGCLKEKEFYCDTIGNGKTLSFRSPLVDPSEVNDVNIVCNDLTKKWFSHFKDQDVVMLNMYDLSLPQQGGMDEDGDAVFLCNEPTVVSSKINKPIIIDIEDKTTAKIKPYTKENLVDYELATRDSRIGEITNAATSIENKYTTNEDVKKYYDDISSLLRVIQGKEIDSIKTGVRWQMTSGIRKHLKQLPWFLLYNYPNKLKTYEKLKHRNRSVELPEDKVKLNAYRSPSPMNELCEYINAWEKKKLIWDNSSIDTRCLIINNNMQLNNKKVIKEVRHLINQFGIEFRELMKLKEFDNTETDCIDILIEEYKDKLNNIPGVLDEEELANYVIKVSYLNNSVCKHLAWFGYGEYIIDNLKNNSPANKQVSIKETPYKTSDSYEYLGKYYIFEEGNANIRQ
ncbi:hypothetical protein [Clostridium sp. HBUAS56010]|uniref:hypothetical protein n=1 Tax=Clostridium sp. HBUAS56010 TaxID=2571127 RepID=UPI001FAAE2FC|nr:hypothetical protein [Clostridium sp. HBUAS56010]